MTKSATQPPKGNVVQSWEEEDYRVKNAREGKAIYIPGRDVEDMKAEEAAKRAAADGWIPPVQFTDDELDRYLEAADELPVLLARAENAFSLICELLQGQGYTGHFGIGDLAYLASRAFASAAMTEGENIAQLGSRLRTVKSDAIKAKIAAGAS
jgi:hypothetical protein